MTKILKTTDNARATLASSISAAATTIALTTGQGSQMPQAKFGTASSAGTSTLLNDTGDLAFLVIGDIIANHTDGSWAVVTATGTNSVTTTPLIGGNDNTWQNGDEWRYNEFVATLTNETVNTNGTITTNKREKILVKNVATDTLTVVRGYDGSTAQTFSANDYCNIFSVSVMNDGIRDALADTRREVNAFYSSIDNLANSQLTHATCTNTGNAYTLTCNAIIDAYVTGMRISFNPSANNTGASTVNLNGLGVKTIKKFATIDLITDDLKSGIPTVLIYDGTNFQMQSFSKNPANPDNTAYDSSWNGDVNSSPTKNAIYDALDPSGNFISSATGVDLGVSTAAPTDANRAIVNLTTDRHTATSGQSNQGQVTIFRSGLTSASIRGVDNGSAKTATVTWNGTNIDSSGDTANEGQYSVYFFKQ